MLPDRNLWQKKSLDIQPVSILLKLSANIYINDFSMRTVEDMHMQYMHLFSTAFLALIV
jgi:hypothetical protein